ncbi:DUF3307 domain-containing protein [Brevibacillus choshinensis]|uniref:DUF3307 domain-containing protein n=1 Tax=Brevibacillus choshinensis TaxID=54911 RepID=A0ABX7FM95_BRECH|nr:DUF3307 domain-containing protein [Brevibacillus choshinensis]QRG66777.1 DUF3307 domain-containing protein [Brevibacillus choshinensis]
MNHFSAFDILFIAHLIGDFLLQTEWMAKYKAQRWLPLLTHCLVYTLSVTLLAFLFVPGGLSVWASLLIFLSHVILDRRTFVYFWYRKVMQVTDDRSKWLMIITDQVFHLIILGVALTIS